MSPRRCPPTSHTDGRWTCLREAGHYRGCAAPGARSLQWLLSCIEQYKGFGLPALGFPLSFTLGLWLLFWLLSGFGLGLLSSLHRIRTWEFRCRVPSVLLPNVRERI